MTPDQIKRKLAAILSADVKGYSRLMGEDEEWTLRTLNAYKGLIRNLVEEHQGRIVGGAGDSILAEFASVVDAVQCGVEIQQALKAKNAILPDSRKMDFRIGINLGDVIEEEDSIYGDGVNIAARLESLAEPGGICISGTAYDHIENKIPLHYDFLGEHEVKNIAKPIRVYRAIIEPEANSHKTSVDKKSYGKGLPKWAMGLIGVVLIAGGVSLYQFVLRPSSTKTDVASKEKMAFTLPDKPSIAVLPFANMSGDPKQEFFSDGITEDIITALSRIPQLFVISRNSTFTYKGKPVKVKQVSEDLGVRYVLEGSVQKFEDRVRITAQLIDALNGHHLWSDRYDRDLKDLFALQDEVTTKILVAMQVKLTESESFSANARHFTGKEGLNNYLKYVEGNYYLNRPTIENLKKSRRIGEEMVVQSPKNPFGYYLLGMFYQVSLFLLDSDQSPQELIDKITQMAQKVLALDDFLAGGHTLLGVSYSLVGNYYRAVEEGRRALELDPNSYESRRYYGRSLFYYGSTTAAIKELQKAIRLNPKGCTIAYQVLGQIYFTLYRYDEAISAYKYSLLQNPGFLYAHLGLIDIYLRRNQEKEARAEASELLRTNPNFSLDKYAKMVTVLFGEQGVSEYYLNNLRKIGLK